MMVWCWANAGPTSNQHRFNASICWPGSPPLNPARGEQIHSSDHPHPLPSKQQRYRIQNLTCSGKQQQLLTWIGTNYCCLPLHSCASQTAVTASFTSEQLLLFALHVSAAVAGRMLGWRYPASMAYSIAGDCVIAVNTVKADCATGRK